MNKSKSLLLTFWFLIIILDWGAICGCADVRFLSGRKEAHDLDSRRESLSIVLSNHVFIKEAAAKGNSVYCYFIEVDETNHLRFLKQNNWVLDSTLFGRQAFKEDDCNYSNASLEFPEFVILGNDSTMLNPWDVTVIAYDAYKTEFGILEMFNVKRKDVVGQTDLLVIYDRKGNYIRTLGRGYQI